MLHLTSLSLFLTIVGIFTSVSLIGAGQILLIIPGLYYFYKAFQNHSVKLPKSSFMLIFFSIAALISLILNHQELAEPGKNYGRLKYLLFSLINVYVFRGYIPDVSEKSKKCILNLSLLAIIVVGFVCCYQVLILGQERAKTLTDTLRYGYGMSLALPIMMFSFLNGNYKKFTHKFFILASIIFGFVGLYLTFNRGAMLALICAIPCTLFFWNKRKGVIAFLFAGIVVSFLGSFYLFGSGQIGNRFISSHKNKSDEMRRSQWTTAYMAWRENPVIGIGYSDFINQEQAFKVKYGIAYPDYKGHAHNVFLEVLSGTGLIGFTFFIAWIICWTIEIFRSSNITSKGYFIPFIVAFLVSGQFEVVLDANNFSMLSIIYGFSIYLIQDKTSNRESVKV